MLPGIRLLFATFVLSASVLIFGLGAAALLRSAHEEFTGIPAWRAAQQPMLPAMDTSRPMLALLRADPPSPPPAAEISEAKDEATSRETTTASIDVPATEKSVAAEIPATEKITEPDQIIKPRVPRAKRSRNIRNARSNVKLIRHWSARTQQTVQPTLSVTNSNAPFVGFDAADTTASSGTASNRRTAGRSPF
jgi:hypothetical protein